MKLEKFPLSSRALTVHPDPPLVSSVSSVVSSQRYVRVMPRGYLHGPHIHLHMYACVVVYVSTYTRIGSYMCVRGVAYESGRFFQGWLAWCCVC